MTRDDSEAVESPPHVDERRMRNIPVADLLAGFAGFTGDAASVPQLRARWATGDRPRPARDVERWAAAAPAGDVAASVAAADTLLSRGPVDFTDTSVGRSLFYGLHYLVPLTCLVQAHAATGEPRYAAGFAEIFQSWYAVRDRVRGEWPGLDVIWYSLGVSVRSLLVSRALQRFAATPEVDDYVWAHLLATLVGGSRWLAEEHARFRHGNWQFGATCALLQNALLLPDHDEAGDWLAVARDRIDEHLTLDVYADGGHYERAPSYHLLCLSAVQDAAVAGLPDDLGLDRHPVVAAMHDWPVAMATPAGWVPPFNDSHIVWPGESLVTGHYLTGREDFKQLVERWVPMDRVREILAWLPPRPGFATPYEEFVDAPSAARDRARSGWLAGSRFAVHRTGWSATDLQLTVNCGPLVEHELESHSHLTALDFVLVDGERPLVWEAGGPANYDDPLYHTWFRSTEAHSTVTVPGRRLDDEHEAALDLFLSLPGIDVFRAHHDGWSLRHRRGLVMMHAPGARPYLLLDDVIEGADGFSTLLHASDPWRELAPDRFRTAAADGLLVVGADPRRLRGVELSEGTASYPRHPPANRAYGPLYALARRVTGDRARTVLLPCRGGEPSVQVEPGEPSTVRVDGVTDVFGENSWVRTSGERVSCGAAWHGEALTWSGRRLASGDRVRAVWARWDGGSTTAHVETTGRTTLCLHVNDAGPISLQGVVIGTVRAPGEVRIGLPSAGTWDVSAGSR